MVEIFCKLHNKMESFADPDAIGAEESAENRAGTIQSFRADGWYGWGSDYNWLRRARSPPAMLVIEKDESEAYGMDKISVWALDNGQYAVVTESGCSCYDSNDADIDLHPTRGEAMEQYDQWVREHSRRND